MNTVLLVMTRRVLADALVNATRNERSFAFHTEFNYQNALITTEILRPEVVVVEIPESGHWSCDKCLRLCDRLRAAHPAGKILALCPEGSAASREATVAAVKGGRIDDFLFYDTSWQYLMSKLESLV